ISQKESNETKHWLRMIAVAVPEVKDKCRELWQEAHELTLIFATISKNCK
ncbi:four helix bundle protein, partial [Candidatus Falkowbacteria bacterium CG_4_8_14_3_um_filter_36_11]